VLFLSSVTTFPARQRAGTPGQAAAPAAFKLSAVDALFGLIEEARTSAASRCALLIVHVGVSFHVRSPSQLLGRAAPIYGVAVVGPQPQPQAPVWMISSSPSLWSIDGRSNGRQPQDPRCRHPQPGLPLSRWCTRCS